jgi:hypothetical protein
MANHDNVRSQRKFPTAMRTPHINYGWNPIESAPFDEDLTLEVTEGAAGRTLFRMPAGSLQPAGRARERHWR